MRASLFVIGVAGILHVQEVSCQGVLRCNFSECSPCYLLSPSPMPAETTKTTARPLLKAQETVSNLPSNPTKVPYIRQPRCLRVNLNHVKYAVSIDNPGDFLATALSFFIDNHWLNYVAVRCFQEGTVVRCTFLVVDTDLISDIAQASTCSTRCPVNWNYLVPAADDPISCGDPYDPAVVSFYTFGGVARMYPETWLTPEQRQCFYYLAMGDAKMTEKLCHRVRLTSSDGPFKMDVPDS
ncbi:MAG: uncharacterized protein KVP18_001966 [Porospora cf. gigantea A]|uniref:uncharacterized protein n=1 Tax=Porospora cf. gigantea A TaxID=2853593 RepID=UPI0035593764|nr:MAG: hypothetical protein KVP18_001966 [Porospora cf. gigantea A]